jgi:hypothetical protein
VVLFHLSEPVLKPLSLEPTPMAYGVEALLVQYGLRVELVSPPAPSYRLLDRGTNAAYMEEEPRAFLAKDPTRFAEVWNLVVGNRIPRPPAPSVDFRTRTVAAFFWGLKPTGGYGLEVVGVTFSGATARVVLELKSPPGGPSSPRPSPAPTSSSSFPGWTGWSSPTPQGGSWRRPARVPHRGLRLGGGPKGDSAIDGWSASP